MSRWRDWVWVAIASVALHCATAYVIQRQHIKVAVAMLEPQVVAAAQKGFKAGYEKGLQTGRLEPSPKTCFGWWFGPENTKDRVQQTRTYLCKSQMK